jgi:hypothetical protein
MKEMWLRKELNESEVKLKISFTVNFRVYRGTRWSNLMLDAFESFVCLFVYLFVGPSSRSKLPVLTSEVAMGKEGLRQQV